MTGLAGELNAQFKTLDLSAQNLLREQQVQVNVPDDLDNQRRPVDSSILARREAGNFRAPLPFDQTEKGKIRGSK